MSSDETLDRLLAGRDRMSRMDKERVFDTVCAELAASEPAQPRRRRYLIAALAGATAIAAIVPVILLTRSSTDDGELVARGGDGAPSFVLRCGASAGTGPCDRGETVAFDIARTAASHAHFAAFAQRESDGLIIWYFPATRDATSIDLARHTERGLIDVGIMLGAEHEPGAYRVYGVFGPRPLSRDDVKAAVQADEAGDDIAVVTRTLVVK